MLTQACWYKGKKMRVLSISNSFGVDATRYLHQIAKAGGDRLEIVTLYIGGCSLERHYRNMLGDKQAYELHYNGQNTGFTVSMQEALLSRKWDVIQLQQQSSSSAHPETFSPYDEALYEFCKECAPQAKIVLMQTWAYEEGSEKLAATGWPNAKAMFGAIEASYAQCHQRLGTDGIIPAGELFTRMLDAGVAKIHRDTFHASLGLGRYALGLLWYRMLTGKTVADNAFCSLDEPATEEEIAIAKRCVDAMDPIF